MLSSSHDGIFIMPFLPACVTIMQPGAACSNVRYGSKADLRLADVNVRFVPEADASTGLSAANNPSCSPAEGYGQHRSIGPYAE
jgi:hypothetical protein